MDFIIDLKNESVIDDFNKWKKENDIDDSVPLFDVSSAGSTTGVVGAVPTVVLNSKANNLWVDTYKDISDPSKLQGKTATKHGVVAERLEVTKKNATDVKNGGNGNVSKLSESQIDTVTDLYIDGNPYQSKFYSTPKRTFDAFFKNERYDNVGKLVPKDQYSEVIKIANEKAQNYKAQAKVCKANGDLQGYKNNLSQAKRCENIAKTAKASEYTYKQSHEGKLVIAGETIKNIASSGAKAGGIAAVTAAAISGATNIFQVAKGEKEAADAIVETAKVTAIAGINGFGIGVGGAALATGLTEIGKKIGSETLKSFASGAGPTYVVVGAVEVTKSMIKYSRGELDEKGLAIELGEKALCTTASAVVGALTAELGPLSIVFSTATYMATSALYRGVVEAIRLSKEAEEARRLLPILQAAYEELHRQTIAFENFINEQKQLRKEIVQDSFSNMEKALLEEDLSKFNNHLGRLFDIYGKGIRFKSVEEFDKIMLDESICLTI